MDHLGSYIFKKKVKSGFYDELFHLACNLSKNMQQCRRAARCAVALQAHSGTRYTRRAGYHAAGNGPGAHAGRATHGAERLSWWYSSNY